MDEEERAAVSGMLTAQKFILENLYALILAQDADPVTAAQGTAAEMLRQFEDLPANAAPGAPQVDADEMFAITQHGIHHLERFWVGVEQRLRSMRR